MSRPWLALVLVLFCVPLFLGLRGLDFETDEAIYSFAVDRMLEDGDWLRPKTSPSESEVFLEKPPLKFWIVAAPIRAGLLPRDEFGMRFADAALGSAAFLYVFAIGWRLAGPTCGAVAVLLLFVHLPLLIFHGLRTNNMESALVLCYCGGVYHYLAWAGGARRGGGHAVATGIYFALGFLTKFVAALFLPLVLVVPTMLFRSSRTRLLTEWRRWRLASAIVLALVLPWFIFARWQFGDLLWKTMVTQHIYTRFTTSLNPLHVQPWSFYFTVMGREFARVGVLWLVIAGVIILGVQSVRRRWLDGAVVWVWGTLPLVLISFGSSKIYHYAYPFLPALALGAGYVAALARMLLPAVVRRLLERTDELIGRRLPALRALASRPWLQAAVSVLIVAAAFMVVWAAVFDAFKLTVGRTVLFKSSGAARPLAAIIVATLLARRYRVASTLVVALAVVAAMPLAAYRDTFPRLLVQQHPLRDAAECLQRVQRQLPEGQRRGLLVDSDIEIWHPINFYLRRIAPWTRQTAPSPEALDRALHDPAALQPALVHDERYRVYAHAPAASGAKWNDSPPMITLSEYVLLLPGPYRVCSPESQVSTIRDASAVQSPDGGRP